MLRLDYLLPEGGRVTGNGSGVLLRMTGSRRRGHYLEANIGKGNTGDIWWAAGRRCTRYRVRNERPIGEWNEYVIEAVGSRIRTWINGKPCVDLDDPPGRRRGIFGLQLHSGDPMEVRFKDMKLEVLVK